MNKTWVKWLPVGIAAIGVGYLTVTYDRLPWIALSLAVTFGLYGLVKKLSPLGSVYGLTLETGIVFPIALAYIAIVQFNGSGEFLHDGFAVDLLLVGAGVVCLALAVCLCTVLARTTWAGTREIVPGATVAAIGERMLTTLSLCFAILAALAAGIDGQVDDAKAPRRQLADDPVPPDEGVRRQRSGFGL